MSKRLDVKYPLFLSDSNETWIFPQIFEKKKPKIPRFIKILPVGTELFHADRHGEANSRFSQLCERA